MKLNFEGIKELKEQMGKQCLFIMFNLRVVVIKMLKITHFLYFLLMRAKNWSV